jgi:hypothetical protein
MLSNLSEFPKDVIPSLATRVARLEEEMKRLKQKFHDANIEEIHHRTGMEEASQTYW